MTLSPFSPRSYPSSPQSLPLSSCPPSAVRPSIPPSGQPSWEDTELRQIHQSAPFTPESWVTYALNVVRSGCIVPIGQPWCHSWDLQEIDWATLCCQVQDQILDYWATTFLKISDMGLNIVSSLPIWSFSFFSNVGHTLEAVRMPSGSYTRVSVVAQISKSGWGGAKKSMKLWRVILGQARQSSWAPLIWHHWATHFATSNWNVLFLCELETHGWV